jgi:hypothetical protein
MPFPIQRVPQGLSQLLSTFGGQTPMAMADQVIGVLDLLQFYGLSQRQTLTMGVAGAGASTTDPQAFVIPSASNWSVLFTVHATLVLQVGTTSVGFGVSVQRPGSGAAALETRDYGTGLVVGSRLCVAHQPGQPLLLPPGSRVGGWMYSTLGSGVQDVAVTADIGVLG